MNLIFYIYFHNIFQKYCELLIQMAKILIVFYSNINYANFYIFKKLPAVRFFNEGVDASSFYLLIILSKNEVI